MGRSTQGVKVRNIKDDDRVSAGALAAESDDSAPLGDENVDQIEIESSTDVDPSVNGASEDGASADAAAPEEDVEE